MHERRNDMPNSMYSLDAGFPRFTGGESDKQKVGAIYDYLIQLQEALRYCLQNLGGDNFNDTELGIIGNTIREPVNVKLKGVEGEITDLKATAAGLDGRIQSAEGDINQLKVTANGYETRLSSAEGKVATLTLTAEGLNGRLKTAEGDVASLKLTAEGYGARIRDAEGNISDLEAKANSYKLTVSNGKSSSTITLMAGETVLSSQNIKFEGVVTFTADENGFSAIDGGMIYSQQIHCDDLWVTERVGCGTAIAPEGVSFWKGKFTNTGAQLQVAGVELIDGALRICTFETLGLDIVPNGDLRIEADGSVSIGKDGKALYLVGDVYVNGTKIS